MKNTCQAQENTWSDANWYWKIPPCPHRSIPQHCRATSIALRGLLLQREAEHARTRLEALRRAELQAARDGLQEQVLRNEQLKLRLAKLLRERFGASSEKLRTAIEQLELMLGDLEEQIAETAPAEPEQPAASAPAQRRRGASQRAGRCLRQPAARRGGACRALRLPEMRRHAASRSART